MPEQSVHHQENAESDQQTVYMKIKGEMNYENNRQYCSGTL